MPSDPSMMMILRGRKEASNIAICETSVSRIIAKVANGTTRRNFNPREAFQRKPARRSVITFALQKTHQLLRSYFPGIVRDKASYLLCIHIQGAGRFQSFTELGNRTYCGGIRIILDLGHQERHDRQAKGEIFVNLDWVHAISKRPHPERNNRSRPS